jgi:hypothetical protein
MTPDEKELLRQKKLRSKDKFEQSNMGDFQNLYPLRRGLIAEHDKLMDEYDLIYKKAKEVYEESLQGGHNTFKHKKEGGLTQQQENLHKLEQEREKLKAEKLALFEKKISKKSTSPIKLQSKRESKFEGFVLPPAGRIKGDASVQDNASRISKGETTQSKHTAHSTFDKKTNASTKLSADDVNSTLQKQSSH